MKESEFVDAEIAFGISLLNKGRRPNEIRSAMKSRIKDDKTLEEVLSIVFDSGYKNKSDKSKKVPVEIIRLNRLKLNFEYSIKNLLKIPFVLGIVGVIVLLLSKPEVNNNAVYGIFTLIQAAFLFVLGWVIIAQKRNEYLLFFFSGFVILFMLELAIFGIPNDLLAAYQGRTVRNASGYYKRETAVGGARFIGFIFPMLYLCVKLMIGYLVFRSYYNWSKYDGLSEDIKQALDEL
jgi:hypothetical protein